MPRPAGNTSHSGGDVPFITKGSIWLFNIAMENPLYMEVSSWENHLFLWAIYTIAMLNNQRVITLISH